MATVSRGQQADSIPAEEAPASKPSREPRHAPTERGRPSSFPPIRDYGFLSDTEVSALVAPSGNIEWLCLPRFDGPSIFGAILDRGAGGFRLGPSEQTVPVSRRYLPGTMVLETSWGTGTGWVIVRDMLLMGPWRHDTSRSRTHVRAPTDYDAEHVLLRTVRCVNGEVQMTLDCEPVFDYGRRRGTWAYKGRGYRRAVCRGEDGDPVLTLAGDFRLGIEGSKAIARHLMKQGETRYIALAWSDGRPPADWEDAYRRMVWTSHHWQHWLARGHFPDHRWRAYLQRSALTLKGLTYAPTGAIMAAPTTSLPETPGGERNWDYRYTWIRDSTLTLWALYRLGFDWEAGDFFAFLRDVAGGDQSLQVMYGVGGERELTETTLDHLRGYEGARPVRIGNGAWNQRQHDMWGALADSVLLHATPRDRLDEQVWEMLVPQVEQAIEHWREPDQGIWEVRGPARHFTSSKVMCWVALDRGARLARLRDDLDLAARWQAVADEIHADVLANGVDERGVFTQHYDTTALDASVLLIPLLGFLPPTDERVRNTVEAIANELTVHGLVLRYRTDETDDGLSGHEATFVICSFWLVTALIEIGEVDEARRLCEKVLSYASPLELFGEEIDPTTGRHFGNFPQGFTHLALINAVMRVIETEETEEAEEAEEAREAARA
ncbi:MAG: glycoside hydrolase family 15 protein [Chloroflexi bacterium]|nr:glycoside hydrolase family 15 protein [Chloroflexota bacterium]